jgi:hypothetical protein
MFSGTVAFAKRYRAIAVARAVTFGPPEDRHVIASSRLAGAQIEE